jgi:hypothetical protein
MADTRKRRLVPYWQPPDTSASDERHALLLTFAHEIRNSPGETPESMARRLLTRLDLRGWGPGNRQASRPVPARRGWCDVHGRQLPPSGRCSGCAADAKAAPDDD